MAEHDLATLGGVFSDKVVKCDGFPDEVCQAGGASAFTEALEIGLCLRVEVEA